MLSLSQIFRREDIFPPRRRNYPQQENIRQYPADQDGDSYADTVDTKPPIYNPTDQAHHRAVGNIAYQKANKNIIGKLKESQLDIRNKLGLGNKSKFDIKSKIGRITGNNNNFKNKISGNLPSNFKKFLGSNKKLNKKLWGDRDKDGVMNVLDCQPNNRKKQGRQHQFTSDYPRGVNLPPIETQRQAVTYSPTTHSPSIAPKKEGWIRQNFSTATAKEQGQTVLESGLGYMGLQSPRQMGARRALHKEYLESLTPEEKEKIRQAQLKKAYSQQLRKQSQQQIQTIQPTFLQPKRKSARKSAPRSPYSPQGVQQIGATAQQFLKQSVPKPFLFYDNAEAQKLKQLTGVRSGTRGKDKINQVLGITPNIESPRARLRAMGYIK